MGLLQWRESASLILAAGKDPLKILFLQRSGAAGNWAKRTVFPGGVVDQNDVSLNWVNHLRKSGVDVDKLLLPATFPRTPILQTKPNELAREIALKITAIRETFEETGILFARPITASVAELTTWRQRLSNRTRNFLNMCDELHICPDVAALKMWSSWLTPANADTKRFDTMFFVAECKENVDIVVDEREMSGAVWFSPAEAISRSSTENFYFATAQVYECARIVSFAGAAELVAFAAVKEQHGVECLAPSLVYCTDGIVVLFPGDDAYPENPEAVVSKTRQNCSVTEFRAGAKNLRRCETTMSDFLTGFHQNIAVHPKHSYPDSKFLQSVLAKRTGLDVL